MMSSVMNRECRIGIRAGSVLSGGRHAGRPSPSMKTSQSERSIRWWWKEHYADVRIMPMMIRDPCVSGELNECLSA